MRERLLQLYHRLPPPLRSFAAGVRGWQLKSWRYGPETDELVAAAHERERWSDERWHDWQDERLARILHRAATRVPFYRALWEERRRRGDRASWEVLANWPLLSKAALRADPTAFVADDRRIGDLFAEQSSGSSGTPLQLWWSRETVRAWYALFEARWRNWYGVSRHDRWAILGGQLVIPSAQRRPPYWVWNAAFRQLYLSSYHLSATTVTHYVEAMRRQRVRYIYGYTSALHALAQYAGAGGLAQLGLEVAIANAEPLLAHQRRDIEAGFGCPVRETYGMSEIVAAAGECERGTLHLWPEVGRLELLDETGDLRSHGVGELVSTGLVNADMPLIRYRVGDRAAVPAAAAGCACGRTLPRLSSIEGRTDDVVYTRDGRAVGRLDPVFKGNLALHEAQLIQETVDRMRVRYVPAPGFSTRDERIIRDGLRERLGEIEVVFEPVAAIERGANGKFRAVVSKVRPAPIGVGAS